MTRPPDPTVPARADALAYVVLSSKRLAELQAETNLARAERDDAVRAALAAGASWMQAAQAGQVSKKTIENIRNFKTR